MQMLHDQRFQQYDYGRYKNRELYGSKSPPEYPVHKIEVPFQIVYSSKDPVFGDKVEQLTISSKEAVQHSYYFRTLHYSIAN